VRGDLILIKEKKNPRSKKKLSPLLKTKRLPGKRALKDKR